MTYKEQVLQKFPLAYAERDSEGIFDIWIPDYHGKDIADTIGFGYTEEEAWRMASKQMKY